jgi:hypothetical protein
LSRTSGERHAELARIACERDLPEPPSRPVAGGCCERGCDPCIWDYYERALARWLERHGVAR